MVVVASVVAPVPANVACGEAAFRALLLNARVSLNVPSTGGVKVAWRLQLVPMARVTPFLQALLWELDSANSAVSPVTAANGVLKTKG